MIRKLFWWALVSPALISIWYTTARVVTVTENHVGIDPWWLTAGAGPAILASVLLPTGWRVAAVAIGLVNVIVVATAIHFNFLLQYEDWIQRGMPDKPSIFGR